MSDTVISVENLSKQYRLGQIGGRTLTEDLNRWWASLRLCSPFGDFAGQALVAMEQAENGRIVAAAQNGKLRDV